jgi:hypothetical protein
VEARGCQSAFQRGGSTGPSEGPQRVTVRGKDTAAVIRAVELERLLPQETKIPFVEFIESLYVEGFNLSREPDYGRTLSCDLGGNAERKQVLYQYLSVGRV